MSTLTDHLGTLHEGTAPPRSWQHVIRHSRLFVVVWSDQAALSRDMAERLAYASTIGRPIRILIPDDTRLPEDAFLGLTDVQVARAATPEAAQAQIEVWLEELREEGR